MRLTSKEREVIYECLKNIWDCYDDRRYYENDPDKEEIRKRLLSRFG